MKTNLRPSLFLRHSAALCLLLLTGGIAFRVYQLAFFYYSGDQYDAIKLGYAALQKHFLITHGLASGVGFNNHPMFLWFMAALTAFSRDPFILTLIFNLINIAALLLCARYFWIALPRAMAVIATAFLSFWPSSAMYANNIWAQCLLPLFMVLCQWQLYYFFTTRAPRYFVRACILLVIAAQLHLSGYFLFPLMLILGIYFRRHLTKRSIALILTAALIILLPYIYHMSAEGHYKVFLQTCHEIKKNIHWKVFREHLRFCSLDFIRYYFSLRDFNIMLKQIFGPAWLALYVLSCTLVPLFPAAFCVYLYRHIRRRKLFFVRQSDEKDYPLAFQICGFMVIGLTLGYLITHTCTPPHYLLILFPSHIIMCAYIAYRLWRFRLARILIITGIIATAVLLLGTYRFMQKSGGYPTEYGPSYSYLQRLSADVWKRLPAGTCPKVSATTERESTNPVVVASVIEQYQPCPAGASKIPVQVTLSWDKENLRYEYQIDIQPKK